MIVCNETKNENSNKHVRQKVIFDGIQRQITETGFRFHTDNCCVDFAVAVAALAVALLVIHVAALIGWTFNNGFG